MTPPELRAHGLSPRHLNYLFIGLFGFPALMGLILALQVYGPSLRTNTNADTPVALSADSGEPRTTFEEMFSPPWRPPRELDDFAHEDIFAARFANLEQKKLVALLDLPDTGIESDLLTSSLPHMPAPQLPYPDFAGEMKFAMSIDNGATAAYSPPAALGQPISGRAYVIDAVTLSVGSKKLQLAGLALPEEGSTCTLLDGGKGDCRKAALDQLDFFLRWRSVACAVTNESEDGVPLASCRVGTSDVGEWLVRRGWAVPSDNAAPYYRSALLFAQSYRLGQWRP